ncbi:OmpH family outer membrane protein [Candidatus Nitronereus thalassa]|uniref:OmpH family outer membrane protein n=1 Tax=Candidatus Nitronereus thalassa TaxID=3020898 RepID=A0ABU3K5X6_9BACT|nr:OmpH family outer membrane protein [Candidatus Nitronereus thalassa]MDT7041822.1 OmpH family outer membrane protein [Candidatus Nitronereus thalassa]
MMGVLLLSSGCMSSSPAIEKKTDAPLAIGVVDTQWLLKESKLGKQVTETLEAFMKDRQTLIELEQKELRNLESQLLRQGSVLSQSARQEREEQFRRRMGEYQQKVANMNQEVQGKQAQLFTEFRDNVDAVVEKLAKRLGLALVVEKGANTPTRYYEPSLDISKNVLEELNQRGP